MGNKKAWLRIAEAFIAIIIMIGVIFVILASRVGNKYDKSSVIYNLQEAILNEIENNNNLREDVLENRVDNINNFIESRIPKNFDFAINICGLNEVCPNPSDSYREDVYVNEVVISASLSKYEPKKLRLFMWEKNKES